MSSLRSKLTFAALVCVQAGCQTAGDRTAAKSFTDVPADRAKAEAAQCAAGSERLRYVLKALPAAPDLTRLTLPPNRTGMELSALLAPIDLNDGLALDLCLDGDNGVKLARMIYLQFGQASEITIPEGSVVNGLEAALGGDYAQLEISVPLQTVKHFYEDQPTEHKGSLLVKGTGSDANGGFVATFLTTKMDGQTVITLDAPTYANFAGKLAAGDFPSNPCPGSVEVYPEFQLGTAHFKAKGCQVTGTSGGASPHLSYLEVTDTNPALPPNVRGQTFQVEIPATPEQSLLPDSKFAIVQTHHMICEGFWAKLPHATYAARGIYGFGGPGESGEPQTCSPYTLGAGQLPGWTPNQGGVSYEIHYQGVAAPVKGAAPAECGHFLFPCAQPGWTQPEPGVSF